MDAYPVVVEPAYKSYYIFPCLMNTSQKMRQAVAVSSHCQQAEKQASGSQSFGNIDNIVQAGSVLFCCSYGSVTRVTKVYLVKENVCWHLPSFGHLLHLIFELSLYRSSQAVGNLHPSLPPSPEQPPQYPRFNCQNFYMHIVCNASFASDILGKKGGWGRIILTYFEQVTSGKERLRSIFLIHCIYLSGQINCYKTQCTSLSQDSIKVGTL